ncbi:uncharacterized protein LOC126324756 [Schistocerca gregaria]|uniref:uncharacterized protein LOC126324756 n=1 Tax=Schistocerca gregaria TaxID=7010 RepID=UPI00211F4564|nr:uncharacterized protein LOC126324756 [Schistocerca gregaria]XP_049851064.1 uncharacterized protein LOC126324756 [Schistocerca gregaria]XP_049851065.1 uncharacterized protein LOC126324756 [Schistocerca gregaria]
MVEITTNWNVASGNLEKILVIRDDAARDGEERVDEKARTNRVILNRGDRTCSTSPTDGCTLNIRSKHGMFLKHLAIRGIFRLAELYNDFGYLKSAKTVNSVATFSDVNVQTQFLKLRLHGRLPYSDSTEIIIERLDLTANLESHNTGRKNLMDWMEQPTSISENLLKNSSCNSFFKNGTSGLDQECKSGDRILEKNTTPVTKQEVQVMINEAVQNLEASLVRKLDNSLGAIERLLTLEKLGFSLD